jgi:hypothetical protein
MIKTNLYTNLRDSAVCMATGYGLGSPGSNSYEGEIFHTLPDRPLKSRQPSKMDHSRRHTFRAWRELPIAI